MDQLPSQLTGDEAAGWVHFYQCVLTAPMVQAMLPNQERREELARRTADRLLADLRASVAAVCGCAAPTSGSGTENGNAEASVGLH